MKRPRTLDDAQKRFLALSTAAWRYDPEAEAREEKEIAAELETLRAHLRSSVRGILISL